MYIPHPAFVLHADGFPKPNVKDVSNTPKINYRNMQSLND
jgi:hypothetical protein